MLLFGSQRAFRQNVLKIKNIKVYKKIDISDIAEAQTITPLHLQFTYP